RSSSDDDRSRRADLVERAREELGQSLRFHVLAPEQAAEAAVLCFPGGLAQKSAKESGGDLGCELRTRVFLQILDNLLNRAATFIWPVRRHCIKRIGKVYD